MQNLEFASVVGEDKVEFCAFNMTRAQLQFSWGLIVA